jgi:hypothetical protein
MLAPVVVAAGLGSAAFIAVPEVLGRRVSLALAGLGLVAILAGPAAYTLQTITTLQQGSGVTAGPTATATDLLSGTASGGVGGGRPGGGGMPGGLGSGMGGGTSTASDSELAAYLVANRGVATWVVAVSRAQTASDLELATGLPVMSTGGWSGSDDALSLDRLEALVASGELRFFIVSSQGGMGESQGGTSEVTSWVTANGTAVTVGGTTLYDLAGVATR